MDMESGTSMPMIIRNTMYSSSICRMRSGEAASTIPRRWERRSGSQNGSPICMDGKWSKSHSYDPGVVSQSFQFLFQRHRVLEIIEGSDLNPV